MKRACGERASTTSRELIGELIKALSHTTSRTETSSAAYIQVQDRRQMKSCDPRDCGVASMSTTKGAIKTWTPDLGQLSHKNTRRITQVASRSGVDKNRNISSAAVGMNPTPPSSNVSGQAWAGHRVLLLKLSSIVRHGGAEYTFGAFAILACCHPGKTQSCAALP